MATAPLPLTTSTRPGSDFQDLLAHRRDLEVRLAANEACRLSAASGIDAIHSEVIRWVPAEQADALYRIACDLRNCRVRNSR